MLKEEEATLDMNGDTVDRLRRRLVGAAAASLAAAGLGAAWPVRAESGAPEQAALVPASTVAASLGDLKQIDAGPLSVGYADLGPGDGPPVLLLHGWPYDIHTYIDVAPLLAAAGYRVIVPYLRGYGTTRFLSQATPRNAQQSVLAVDVLALMDALGIAQAVVAGCDWGARTANILAALWPERCNAMVSVSGYLIGSQAANRMPLPPSAELHGGISTILRLSGGRRVTRNTRASSRGSSGSWPSPGGASTTRPSSAVLKLWRTRITSPSLFTTTAGGSD